MVVSPTFESRVSFDVCVADEAFAQFAKTNNLSAASLLPEDEFFRPLLLSIAERLTAYPFMPPLTPPVRMHLGIIEHPEPNAFAECFNGTFFLAIHSGQLLSAVEAAVQMQDALGAFAQKFGVGQSSSEASSLKQPLGVTSFLNYLRGVENSKDLFGEQKDTDDPATRRAMLFTVTCIQFAFLHEFGHVVRGHLGWLTGKQCRAKLKEIEISGAPASPELQSALKFFEHEADVFALEVLLRSTYSNFSDENNLIVVMLAFLSTVFGWTVLEQTPGLGLAGDHPGANDRMLALHMALIGMLEQIPESANRMQCAIQRCSAIVTRIAHKYPPFTRMQSAFSTGAVERADKIGGWMREMDCATADRTNKIV